MSKKFHRKNNGLRGRYKCKCGRAYMMDWALKNHQQRCYWAKNEK